MITLTEFINKTKGKKIALPWFPYGQKGQCVSLIQQYIKQCLGQNAKARGNAKDWVKTYPAEGLGSIVNKPQRGDIIVFPHEGKYGHIAIYIDSNTLYDQNNGRHDKKKAGYGTIFSKDYVVLRPNVSLISEDKAEWQVGTYKLLNNKAIRRTHDLGNNILKVKNCGKETKKYLTSTNKNDDAYLKKGTEVKARKIYKDLDGRVWGSYGNCWLVLCNKDGTAQAKKV